MAMLNQKDDQPSENNVAPVEAATPTDPNSSPANGETISWTASEFIAHQKSAGWYGVLATGTIIVATAVYFLTKDKISTIAVVVVAGAFGFYAARQPRQLEYRLDNGGVGIGHKYYPYASFRSFAVVPE